MKKINLFATLCFVAILLASCGGEEKDANPMDAWEDAMSDFEDAMEESMDDLEDVTEDYADCDESDDVSDDVSDDTDEVTDDSENADANEWDAVLDEYDSWADEYITVLKKVKADPTDATAAQDMASMGLKAAEWTQKLGKAGDLTTEQAARYAEIGAKIAKGSM